VNECGEIGSEEFTIQVDNSIGVVELPEWQVLVFPNPVRNNLSIASPGFSIERIEILTTAGVTISQFINKNTSGEIVLNVAHLSSGIYYLRVYSVNGVTTKKFSKL